MAHSIARAAHPGLASPLGRRRSRGTSAARASLSIGPSEPLAGGGDHWTRRAPRKAPQRHLARLPSVVRSRRRSCSGRRSALSAFLLFTVQPLVGRLLLPAYGGAPAVWATVLAFFQVVLLGGYAYAHVVATRLSPNRGAALHLAVLCVALVFTLLTPSSVASLFDPAEPTIPGLVRVLVLLIGAPAFVLTATTPLVSTWYARVRHATDPDGDPREPYWLYALSNGGSLVSLLAYPLLIEGQIGLSQQRSLWIAGVFVLLGLLVVAVARAGDAAGGSAAARCRRRGTDLVLGRGGRRPGADAPAAAPLDRARRHPRRPAVRGDEPGRRPTSSRRRSCGSSRSPSTSPRS